MLRAGDSVLQKHREYEDFVRLDNVHFFFNDPATTEIYTLSLHDALPISACLIMEGAEFTENIINGVERPVKAAELFAFTLRVRAGNTDVLTDAEENVRQKLRAEGVM